MTVLLGCSTSWLKSNAINIPSTGEQDTTRVCTDSVLISYCDLRAANAKLIELKYEKAINSNFRTIITNDSIAISNYKNRLETIQKDTDRSIKEIRKERNIAIGGGLLMLVFAIVGLLK